MRNTTIYFFTNGAKWLESKPFSVNAEMPTQEFFLLVSENLLNYKMTKV